MTENLDKSRRRPAWPTGSTAALLASELELSVNIKAQLRLPVGYKYGPKCENGHCNRMSARRTIVVLLCVVCSTTALPYEIPAVGIVGGNVTNIKKVPYQAAVLFPSRSDLLCGASIISRNYLLTAGHCCSGLPELILRVGSSDYQQGGTIVGSTRMIIHPKYKGNPYPDYDACIIQTSTPLRFGRKVQPLPIAKSLPQSDDIVMVAGWGWTETGNVSRVLRSVLVPVTNSTYCQKGYPFVADMGNFICAGVEGKDSCYGDSGGALTWRRRLVGIVSFGHHCALKGYPGVYTKVLTPGIREFIRNVTGV